MLCCRKLGRFLRKAKMKCKKLLVILISIVNLLSTNHAQAWDFSTKEEIKTYVDKTCTQYGIPNWKCDWIITHESQWNPKQKGDDGNSRGLWQISSIYHPEVSNQCAYNVQCATLWSILNILKGNINQWSSWRFRKLWYNGQAQTN